MTPPTNHRRRSPNDEPLVSVVVPVFQVEAYLERCLDSVLRQTYTHLQVILIDDGSTDGSSKICDDYASRDTRIAVVHQPNMGLAGARNRGLEMASGAWVTFLDSDDWLHPRMIETLLTEARQDADAVVAGFDRVGAVTTPPQISPSRTVSYTLTTLETLKAFVGDHHTRLTISCAKLFRRELFADIRFPVGRLHEDEFTTYRLLARCQFVTIVPLPLYFYYSNPHSITGGGLSLRHRRDLVDAFREQADFFAASEFASLAPQARSNLLRKQFQYFNALVQSDEKSSATAVLHEARATLRMIPWTRSTARLVALGHLFVNAPSLALSIERLRVVAADSRRHIARRCRSL